MAKPLLDSCVGRWYMCVWCMCTCVYRYMSPYAHRGQTMMLDILFYHSWLYSLGQHLSLNMELVNCLSSPTNCHFSTLQTTRVIGIPGLLHGFWGPKLRSSGFHSKCTYPLRHLSSPRTLIYTINLFCAKAM